MGAAEALAKTGFRFTVEVTRGPNKGARFQLLPPRTTIGRGEMNDIIIADAKVSRQAVVIAFSVERITITDVSGRQSLTVNDQVATETELHDGDRIGIGQSEIRFFIDALILTPDARALASPPSPSSLMLAGNSTGALTVGTDPSLNFPMEVRSSSGVSIPLPSAVSSVSMPSAVGGGRQAKSTGSRRSRPSRVPWPGIIIVLVISAVFILFNEPKAKKPDSSLRTTALIEKEVEESKLRTGKLQDELDFKTELDRTQSEEAKRNLIRGMRDFRMGNFSRAMDAFTVVLATQPDHRLAQLYLKKSERRREELISQLMTEGRGYKDKGMYRRCTSSAEKVLILKPVRGDASYKEAEALKTECDLLERKRY